MAIFLIVCLKLPSPQIYCFVLSVGGRCKLSLLLGEGNMEFAKHEVVNLAIVVNISTNLSSFFPCDFQAADSSPRLLLQDVFPDHFGDILMDVS